MQDGSDIYHRLANKGEADLVRQSSEVWGKAPRTIAGNGPPCVKAFLGPLPKHENGYSFRTSIAPSGYGMNFGRKFAKWEDGASGVETVPGRCDYVKIDVEFVE